MGSYDAGYGTWCLEDLVGRKRAKEMWFLNEKITAARALEMGLINRVAPAGTVDDVAAAIAQDLLAKSPTVLRVLKMAIAGEDVLGDDVIPMIVESLAPFFGSAEQREATTAFAEKREPNYQQFRRSR